MNTIKKLSLLSILLTSLFISNSPQVSASDDNGGVLKSYGKAVSEIFMTGKVGSHNLYLVLGFGKSAPYFMGTKKVFDVEEIRESADHAKRDFEGAGKKINDPTDFEMDYKEVLEGTGKFTKESAIEIFKGPLKTFANMKDSYEVSFENARAAKFETENYIAANTKYAGHAIWANVKGSYYLLIEAPAKVLTYSFLSAVAVPSGLIFQTGSVLWNVMLGTFRVPIEVSWQLTKATTRALLGFGALTYSAISTSTAIAGTTLVSGTVLLYEGAKKVVTFPFNLLNPTTNIKTKVSGKEIDQLVTNLTDKLEDNEYAQDLGIDDSYSRIKKDKKFDKEIEYLSGGKTLIKLKLTVKNKKVRVTAKIKRSHYKAMYKEAKSDDPGLKKRTFKKALLDISRKLIETASESLTKI